MFVGVRRRAPTPTRWTAGGDKVHGRCQSFPGPAAERAAVSGGRRRRQAAVALAGSAKAPGAAALRRP
eukprot:1824537-Prymnesium_polylepis.1